MLNHVVVIGKVYSMPIEKKDKKGNREISFILQVERAFTESDGSYVFDYVKVCPWKGIAEQMKELCTVGSMVAIKGRFQCASVDAKDVKLIAEHISFISVNKK